MGEKSGHFEHPAGERIAQSSEHSGALEASAGSSVAINGPTVEKTPDPLSFPDMDYISLDLQLGDSGNKQIKKIPISHRTLLAF